MQHDEITTIIKKFNDANMPSINSLVRNPGFKAISLTFLLVLVPALAYGAGLGRIDIKSALGEPLNADIELLEISAKEAATLVARIGNNDEYLTAGLQDAIVPPGVRVTSVTRPDGAHVLHVTTPRAVNEPFLELLIKVDSDNLHMVRQYTVLLDPPTSKMGDEPAVVNTIPELKSDGLVAEVPPPFHAKSKSRKSRSGANGAEAASSSGAVKPINIPLSGDTYLTQPGDIFGKVAQQYQPAGVPLKKVMAAFYAANPEAFLDGDINQLKSGQVLKIPSPEAMGGTLPNKAQPAVVEVPPPAAPKSADAAPNPEFVLKISPEDTSDATDQPGQSREPAANGSTDGQSADPQATPAPEPVAPAPSQPATLTPALATAANPPQPGLWETVFDRLIWIGLGLLLGLVSLGLVYYLHLRRLMAMQKWHESMVQTTTRPHPNDVEPTVVSTPPIVQVQPVASSPAPAIVAAVADETQEAYAPVATSSSAASQEADFDIHEVDPIVEAEIYISYGRDEQAENILLNALEKTPDRHQLTLCLLKIYAERQDAIAFDNLALRLKKAAENAEPGTLEQWHSAAVMGHKLSPHNPLYVIEGLTDQEPASEPEDEEDTLMLPELEPIAEEPPELPEFEPLKPLAETNILEFTFEKIPSDEAAKNSTTAEEHERHDPLFPAEKK